MTSYPKFGKWWTSSKPWKQNWMSDTSRDWERRVEGFREHIAVDGSLKGVSGRDAARGLADYVKDSEPWAMLAEMEV